MAFILIRSDTALTKMEAKKNLDPIERLQVMGGGEPYTSQPSSLHILDRLLLVLLGTPESSSFDLGFTASPQPSPEMLGAMVATRKCHSKSEESSFLTDIFSQSFSCLFAMGKRGLQVISGSLGSQHFQFWN